MSTSSLNARVRNLVAALAAAGVLALVAGGGAAAASRSVSALPSGATLPQDRPATLASHGLTPYSVLEPTRNWAGYVIHADGNVGYVSGIWTVPTLNCQETPNAADGVWAGIGGDGNDTGALLQTGVADNCTDGSQQDQAWWELVENGSMYPPYYFGMSVSPGDEMQASVYLDQSGQWVTRIDDLTTGISGWMTAGGTYGTEQDGSASYVRDGSSGEISYDGGSSVEWVVEGPGLIDTGQNFQPITDFGTVQFSDLRAGLQSWSLNAGEADQINCNNQVVADPGTPDGDGFSVSYTEVTAVASC